MALVGNMIATAFAGNSAMVNYVMFVSVFGMASLLYLLPTSFLDSFHVPLVVIALDALNALFWFCAAVALPAYLGVHSCSNRVCFPPFPSSPLSLPSVSSPPLLPTSLPPQPQKTQI
jgi:hypothetical protein